MAPPRRRRGGLVEEAADEIEAAGAAVEGEAGLVVADLGVELQQGT